MKVNVEFYHSKLDNLRYMWKKCLVPKNKFTKSYIYDKFRGPRLGSLAERWKWVPIVAEFSTRNVCLGFGSIGPLQFWRDFGNIHTFLKYIGSFVRKKKLEHFGKYLKRDVARKIMGLFKILLQIRYFSTDSNIF